MQDNTITIKTPIGAISMYKSDLFYHDMKNTHQYAEQSIIDGELSGFIRSSKNILDIGGHVGYHSIAYAKMNPDVNIMTFEPQKKIYDLLVSNIERNGYSSRIKAFNKAVGHENGEIHLSMYVDDGPTTDKPLDYEGENVFNFGGLSIGNNGTKVEMITVDSLNLTSLDYMKVDVEGAEPLVFMGAKETILRHKPVICFEDLKNLNPDYTNSIGISNMASSYEILRSYGYSNFIEIPYKNIIATV